MVQYLKDILGRYFVTFDKRMLMYQVTVVHQDTGKKIDQFLPEDHFTEDTVKKVIEYCIEQLKNEREKTHNSF